MFARNKIRVTPAATDRRGWIWNDYGVESDDFEIEIKFQVGSKPHFGGDGFGIWLLHGDMDPSTGLFIFHPFSQLNDSSGRDLTGPVVGLRDDFIGCGVVVDTYDNDNRRNNPAVFMLCNRGKSVTFDHDGDYERDMITTKPSSLPTGSTAAAHKCVADVRNTGKIARLLLKVVDDVAHVYVDQGEGLGFRFCLAVELPDDLPLMNHHLVITGATGGVSDNLDVVEITTRYLALSLFFFFCGRALVYS